VTRPGVLPAVALGLALGFAAGAAAQPTPPKLISTQATIEAEAHSGDADLVLQVPASARLTDVQPVNIDGPDAVLAAIRSSRLGSNGDAQDLYRLHIHVAGLPSNYSHAQYVRFRLGDDTYVLSYTLSNQPSDTPAFAVSLGPAIAIKAGEGVPITVMTGQGRITGLRVDQWTLAESQTHQSFSDGALMLCRAPEPSREACPRAGIDLRAGTSTPVWIVGGRDAGQFDGYVTLVSHQTPAGIKSDKTSIYVTSWLAKFFGLALIAIGITLSFLLSNVLRSFSSREQGLLQAARLRVQLDTLLHDLHTGRPCATAKEITKKIAGLGTALSVSELEAHGVPGWLPPVFSAPGADDQQKSFQTYLQNVVQWISAIEVMIDEGLHEVDRRFHAAQPGPEQHALKTVYSDIDRLAISPIDQPPTVAAVRQAINASLAATPPAKLRQLVTLETEVTPLPAPDVLQKRLNIINGAGWLYVLVITLILGCYELFVSNGAASFGIVPDYVAAFLWGLGFPVGAQLAQSAVATALGGARPI